MEDAEIEQLIKNVSARELKEEAKKRGIPLGRCPSKMDIARKLPKDALEKLSKK